MTMMKKLILSDWRARLACIAVAFAIWYLIRSNIQPQLEWRPYIPPPNLQEELTNVPE